MVALAVGVLVGAVVAYLLLLVFFVGFLVLPNPARSWATPPGPERYGLQAQPLRLGTGQPGWWVAHPTSRRIVVVCHGRSRSANWMLPAVARLAKSANVLAFDFPGHGGNGWGLTTLGAREVDVVDAAIDKAVALGFDDVVVYGTSMGGASTIWSQGRRAHPAVRAIVTDGAYDRLQRVIDGIANNLPLPPMVSRHSMALVPLFAGFRPADVAPVEVVGNITVPCLFLHGDQDPLVPVAAAYCYDEASGPQARLHIYPGLHDDPTNPHMLDALEAYVTTVAPAQARVA